MIQSSLSPPAVPGLAVTDLAVKTDSQGTDLIPFNRGGVDYSTSVTSFLAANSTSATALTAGPGLASGDVLAVSSVAAAGDVKYTMAQLVAYVASQIGSTPAATTFAISLSSASGVVGSSTTMTVTPGTGGWPSGEVVTAVATTVTGSFDAATKTGSGMTPVTFTFTSSGSPNVGSLNATAPGMTSGGAQTYTSTSAGTAPSTVGSLAAGTPTSTTIPVTYTAATGTATITYTGQTKPHGSGSYTSNAGTFTSTGGTFTGLTASTSYDLQITATNGTGSSTTTLVTGVSTAAAGATYPALALTSPLFETASPITGAASLKGGVGTATIAIPLNAAGSNQASVSIKGRFKGTGTPPGGNPVFLSLTRVSDSAVVLTAAFSGGSIIMTGNSSYATSSGTNLRDGSAHFFNFRIDCAYSVMYANMYIDGNNTTVNGGNAPPLTAGNYVFKIDYGGLATADLLDDILITADVTNPTTVPSGAAVRDANTIVIYNFDAQNGTGS